MLGVTRAKFILLLYYLFHAYVVLIVFYCRALLV